MAKLGSVSVGDNHPTRIMGILNVSPESFYKKSIKKTRTSIIDSVKQIESEGADFIDIGGMSTAPYLSTLISEKEETTRLSTAIRLAQDHSNLPISVDTCRCGPARASLELGAEILNDISGLKYDEKIVDIVAKFYPSVILCAFSKSTVYGDHIQKTRGLLKQSIAIAKSAGLSKERIVLDPAIGFFRKEGKNPFFTKIRSDWKQRDLSILENLKKIKGKFPMLISVSNKSIIGEILDQKDPAKRIFGSIAAEAISVINGADIIRTHNVLQTRDAVKIAERFRV